MCVQPSMPMAPPITVPSVQNAMVRRPFTVPAAASTPERSRSCRSSTLPSSKKLLRRSNGSRGSSDSPTDSGAMIVIADLLFRGCSGYKRGQYRPKAIATLWPPNPNELLIAYL